MKNSSIFLFFLIFFLSGCTPKTVQRLCIDDLIPRDEAMMDYSINDLMVRDDTVKDVIVKITVPNTDISRKEIFNNIESFNAQVYWQSWYNENTIDSSGTMNILMHPKDLIPMIKWLDKNYNVTELIITSTDPYSDDTYNKMSMQYSTIDLIISRNIGILGSFYLWIKRNLIN